MRLFALENDGLCFPTMLSMPTGQKQKILLVQIKAA